MVSARDTASCDRQNPLKAPRVFIDTRSHSLLAVTQRLQCGGVPYEMPGAPRVLFVPVSSPRGSGEYARTLSLATALTRKVPATLCHFALSEEAPYARECPFPATLLPSSPTFHTAEIAALIVNFQPTVVVFDNAGRTAQIQTARKHGARVIFISSRQRQRRRAYRLRWLRMLDEHWIACPELIAGAPSLLERSKAAIANRPLARYMDCLIPDVDGRLAKSHDHILVLTGGVADSRSFAAAPHVMAQVAARLAAEQVPVILVGAPTELVPSRVPANLTILPRLAVTEVGARIQAAQVVICNGGDTLIQVLALERPCVAIAMAPDQVIRLKRCQKNGVDVQASIDTEELLAKTRLFWNNTSNRIAQVKTMQRLSITNKMDQAISTIIRLANCDANEMTMTATSPRATG